MTAENREQAEGSAGTEKMIVDVARELYDRWVTGGEEPPASYALLEGLIAEATKQLQAELEDDFRWLQKISDALDGDRTRPDDLGSILHEIFILKSKARREDRAELRVTALQAELREAREALKKYGNHLDGCLMRADCYCGWKEIADRSHAESEAGKGVMPNEGRNIESRPTSIRAVTGDASVKTRAESEAPPKEQK